MKSTLTVLSPAKLNLFLHITGRRPDGYHLLQTVFQLLDYGDTMHFCTSNSGDIKLNTLFNNVKHDDNLIVKAARLLQDYLYQRRLNSSHGNHLADSALGASIEIDKQLPMGGGLGGGSSNAATTLLSLNQLWQGGLSTQQLAQLSLPLGADVPVFVHGHSAWAEGVGEQLDPIDLPEQWYLVLIPPCHVSTQKIFLHKELTRDTEALRIAAFRNSGSCLGFNNGFNNDCEAVVRKLYSEVDAALTWLQRHSNQARLTGTGACVFAAFDSYIDADSVLKQVPESLTGFVAAVTGAEVHCIAVV